MDAAVRAVSAAGSGAEPELYACSSAGGGMRLAVVGAEMLMATEAGHRVACSAGAHVVHVHAGPLQHADLRTLRTTRPTVLLLLGGYDGDDPADLLHNAGRLAGARVRFPIVLAAPEAVRDDALAVLRATGRTVVTCENVLPQRGQIVAEPARAALAALYRRHAVGGRGPAVGPRFRRLVRVATPEAVGHGAVELARIRGGRVLVVDVGCATTDVHSAADGAGVRTVEGDLGVRAAAGGVLVGAQAEGVVDPVEADLLAPTVARMTSEVGYVPGDPGSAAEDRRVAALAAVVAVRRHLRAQVAEREAGPRRAVRRRVPQARPVGRPRGGVVHAAQRPGARARAGRRAGGDRHRLRRGPRRAARRQRAGRGGRVPLARPPARLTGYPEAEPGSRGAATDGGPPRST